MKKSKFTDEQIAFVLKQAETGTKIAEVCRKRNMKILFIGPMPPPLGGVAVINQSLQNLDFKGRFEPISFGTSKGTKNEDLYCRRGIANVKHLLGNIKCALRYIRASNIRIVNLFATSNIAFLRDALLILLFKLHGKRVIVHFHSKKQGEFFLNRFSISFISAVFRIVDKIIVLSPDHYAHFSSFFPVDKMEILENFVDTDCYACEKKDKKKEFLYVGRLSERKGFFDLLSAIKQIKDDGYTLIVNIIGVAENDATQKTIDAQIEKDGTSSMFVFHGYRIGEEKFRLFRRCKFLVFPSHFENSPVVLKEAMAAKMKVVLTSLDANKTVMLDYPDLIYTVPGDPRSLYKAMRKSFDTDETDQVELHPYSTDRFDVKYATEKFIKIMENVA